MRRNCAPEKLRAAEDQQAHLYTQRKSLIEQNIRSSTAGGWVRPSAPRMTMQGDRCPRGSRLRPTGKSPAPARLAPGSQR
jgi:hypothetical protein